MKQTALILVAGCGLMAAAEPPVRIAELKVLSTNGSARGAAYSLSNKIVTWESRTHVSWLDNGTNGRSMTRLQTYDRATGQWSPAYSVGVGRDNHAGPSLAVDSKGYLHILHGAHADYRNDEYYDHFQYRRSIRPNDAFEWTETELVGHRVTYPSMVIDAKDCVHLVCRGGVKGFPDALHYYRKPADGVWSKGVALVSAAVPNGYTQFGNALAVDAEARLHLAFHIYDRHPAAGKTAGYLRSSDGGNTWTRADGVVAALPATPKTVDAVEAGPELDMRVGNVVCDARGNPWFGIVHFKGRDRALDLWRRDRRRRSTLISCGPTGRSSASFRLNGARRAKRRACRSIRPAPTFRRSGWVNTGSIGKATSAATSPITSAATRFATSAAPSACSRSRRRERRVPRFRSGSGCSPWIIGKASCVIFPRWPRRAPSNGPIAAGAREFGDTPCFVFEWFPWDTAAVRREPVEVQRLAVAALRELVPCLQYPDLPISIFSYQMGDAQGPRRSRGARRGRRGQGAQRVLGAVHLAGARAAVARFRVGKKHPRQGLPARQRDHRLPLARGAVVR
jgi:hypothetical protein